MAQKFLACLYRVREKSGFDFGLNHAVDILTGGNTEAIRKWGHDSLSTYNIGEEFGRDEWKAIGRELMRLGLARQTPGRMSVLELTGDGRDWLRSSEPLQLTRPALAKSKLKDKPRRRRIGEIQCDENLFERLRELRARLAQERGVPAYIVFGDVSLRQMARDYPTSTAAFGLMNGVGDIKLKEFAEVFTAEIAEFLREHPRKEFAPEEM